MKKLYSIIVIVHSCIEERVGTFGSKTKAISFFKNKVKCHDPNVDALAMRGIVENGIHFVGGSKTINLVEHYKE